MKGAALFIAIFALALLVVPMVALGFSNGGTPAQVHVPNSVPSQVVLPGQGDSVEADPTPAPSSDAQAAVRENDGNYDQSVYGVESFRILDESTGQVTEVSVRDYVRGAVAAEMYVSFHPEALKAQAVAAHTYALYHHYQQQVSPDPALKGADFSADPANRHGYMTEEAALAWYGENAEVYWKKVCDAVDAVLPYILEYDGEPIVAAYHAMSAGWTEDASNVWTGSVPYLRAAASEGDLLAPDYETEVTLSRETVQSTLRAAYPSAQFPSDPADLFSDIVRSDSGYIVELDAGGLTLHGKDVRTLFDLRSHNLDILYNAGNDTYTFVSYGYGHGVGMSQYGADFLARQGYTFEEILAAYYAGTAIKTVNPEIAL